MVSVIIPCFDRWHRLAICLRSIASSEPKPPEGVETIVVTAGLTSESRTMIKDLATQVVELPIRTEVSAARNAGAAAAHGTQLLFLDDDNVVAPNAIYILSEALSAWDDAVMVGPAMYFGDAPTRLWCAGIARTRVLMKTKLRASLPEPLPERLRSDDFPNCFLVRRKEFEHVRGFDAEAFPRHYEEGDLARRLVASTELGVFCVPSAKVWHFIGQGLDSRLHIKAGEAAYWLSHGRAAYTSRYGGRTQLLAYLALGQWLFAGLYISNMLRLPSDHRNRAIAAYVRGLRDGVGLVHAALKDAK
jgi:GT2 family glycosyltransferase